MRRAGGAALGGAPVRAVLLDVDGTLYDQRSLRIAMLWRLARHAARSPREGREVLRALRSYRRAQETLRAVGPAADDGRGALRQLGVAAERCGIPEERLQAIVRRWMEEEPLPLLASRARPGLTAFLRALAGCGIPVGIVSDYPARAKLERLGIAELCATVVCAQDPDVGCFKPHPRGLLVAAERLGVEPAETLYVGDRPEVDAAAARAAGMRCVIVAATAAGKGGEGAGGWIAVRDFDGLARLLLGS